MRQNQIKYRTNPPFSVKWTTSVGKLILNFGALEFETYLWYVQLSEDVKKLPAFQKVFFKNRVEQLIELAQERSYSKDWLEEVYGSWDKALEYAKFRNTIAHSPLTFGWNSQVEEGDPDFIGVLDLKPQGKIRSPLASIKDLDNHINGIVSLAVALRELREKWCSIRDQQTEPESSA